MSYKVNTNLGLATFPNAKSIAVCLIGTLALALSAQITMPLGIVPGTMQTFAVLLLAAILPYRLAVATFLLYLTEGLFGLPVFAEGGFGVAILVGPRGGYLIGMLLATALVSHLLKRTTNRHWYQLAPVLLLGSVVLYTVGLLGLSRFIPQSHLLEIGLYPFALSELLKIALVVMSCRLIETAKKSSLF